MLIGYYGCVYGSWVFARTKIGGERADHSSMFYYCAIILKKQHVLINIFE